MVTPSASEVKVMELASLPDVRPGLLLATMVETGRCSEVTTNATAATPKAGASQRSQLSAGVLAGAARSAARSSKAMRRWIWDQ